MSMTPPPSLPAENGIDTLAFAETLDATTASYKFFWLLALLEILKGRDYRAAAPIPFSEFIFVMLKRAKASVCRFNLSFGMRDHMREHLKNIERQIGDDDWEKADAPPECPAFGRACANFALTVPYLWIRPFVANETAGAGGKTRSKTKLNNAIAVALFKKAKGGIPPPYVINNIETGGGHITIHPLWADYLSRNADLVEGWCLWHFANFAQARNPNIPAIVAKLAADEDDKRNSLAKPREFWRMILPKLDKPRCIYSDRELSANNFALDHYVPWSFVGHDSMWNLIPAHPEVNSSKSDNLPNDDYLTPMVKAHHNALIAREEHFPKKWDSLLEFYVADLKLQFSDLTNYDKLRDAYQNFIPPLIDLAKANRFDSGWVWNPKAPLLEKRD